MNKTKFKALFNLIEQTVPDMSINQILEVMYMIDMEAYGKLGCSITGTLWIKTQTSVRPANLEIPDVMAIVAL